jgi:Leucine-rich repeat (LRR) protein
MNKTLHTLIAIFAFTFTISAQNINIPDANFKKYLLNNTQINTDADKLEISVAEAVAFNGKMYVSSTGITSLVGIEMFIKLTALYCDNNQLTSLDVTKNTALTGLYCDNNQLTSLDITKNTALTGLYCNNNQLTSLDVTKNTALFWFYSEGNQLTSLDVTKNTALITLYCDNNQLTSLDVTKNTALTTLYCDNNQLTSLDVTKNTALNDLRCSNNQLTSLDVTKNTTLFQLYCNYNQLTSLDVTKNKGLSPLHCISNPKLNCIQALNSQFKFYWTKDNIATYSENCNYTVGINDEILIQPKIIQTIYNLLGQQVNTTYQGLVIIRYTDGTSQKVIQ